MVGFHFTSLICRHLLYRHPYRCKISILTLAKKKEACGSLSIFLIWKSEVFVKIDYSMSVSYQWLRREARWSSQMWMSYTRQFYIQVNKCPLKTHLCKCLTNMIIRSSCFTALLIHLSSVTSVEVLYGYNDSWGQRRNYSLMFLNVGLGRMSLFPSFPQRFW